jgi:AmiR/NasT family two-component response regulator
MQPGHPLRIVAAASDPAVRQLFETVLPLLGHQVHLADSASRLTELCHSTSPDLVITEDRLSDGDSLEAVAVGLRSVPVVLVTASPDYHLLDRAVQGPVWACLVKPIAEAHLGPTIELAVTRFAEHETLRQEAERLRQAVEDGQVVERAREAVQRRCHADEREADQLLHELSEERHEKLTELAREIETAEDILEGLERL